MIPLLLSSLLMTAAPAEAASFTRVQFKPAHMTCGIDGAGVRNHDGSITCHYKCLEIGIKYVVLPPITRTYPKGEQCVNNIRE